MPGAVRGDLVRVRDVGDGREGLDEVLDLVAGDPAAVTVDQPRGLAGIGDLLGDPGVQQPG